jgi:hypothetical protein
MISSLVGVPIIWLAAVDRVLRFQIEVYPEADRDSVLVILVAFLSSCSWVWLCWMLNLP